jgi:hypothetical protein
MNFEVGISCPLMLQGWMDGWIYADSVALRYLPKVNFNESFVSNANIMFNYFLLIFVHCDPSGYCWNIKP